MVNMDFEDIFNLLDKEEQKEFIDDHYDNYLFSDSDIAEKAADYIDIDTAIAAFSEKDIKEWLYAHADDYGYAQI